MPRPGPVQKTYAHVATRAQWRKHTSSTQAHTQTEPRCLWLFVRDAWYAGFIPPSGSESKEYMVPGKRCLRSPPPEPVLIGWLGLEAGRGPIWAGNHFPKREAGSHPVSLVSAEESAGCRNSGDPVPGGQAGVRVLPQLRPGLHRSATARFDSFQPGAAAPGTPAGSLKSLLGAASRASPGPPAEDLAPCCKIATSLSASALPAVSHRHPGPERLPWTWD